MLRLEVVIVHHPRQMAGDFELSLDESPIDSELRGFIGQLACAPSIHLPSHRFEVALHAVNADGKAVLQSEILGVLC